MSLISDSAEIETRILSLVIENGLNPYSKTHKHKKTDVYNLHFVKLLTSIINYAKEDRKTTNQIPTFLQLSPKQANEKTTECLNQLKLTKRFLQDLYESNIFTVALQYTHDKRIDVEFFESFFINDTTEEHLYNVDTIFYQIQLLLNNVTNLIAMASENKWKSMNDGLCGTNEFHLAIACLQFLNASGFKIKGNSFHDFMLDILYAIEEETPLNKPTRSARPLPQETANHAPIDHACRLALEWWKATQEPEGGGPSNRPMDADDIWWRTQFPAPLPANRPARKKSSKKSTLS